jgi:hypothetical protein
MLEHEKSRRVVRIGKRVAELREQEGPRVPNADLTDQALRELGGR